MLEHAFTVEIRDILTERFGADAEAILAASPLLQYLNLKTTSVNKGSKARSSFGSIYALFTLIEDYVRNGFSEEGDYSKYPGAIFSELFKRQRELPFGSKLQNHYFNNRVNGEFRKYFPSVEFPPIMLDQATNRYWVNENLLKVNLAEKELNLSRVLLDIVERYIAAKQTAFDRFVGSCQRIQEIHNEEPCEVRQFIEELLRPEVDARIFEIVSFVVLKEHFGQQAIFWGWTRDEVHEEILLLYKTGRTNANDGGIDFVMKPLGRFFQVTETTDFKKYFLDIDKVHRYPITFVVKSTDDPDSIRERVRTQAIAQFSVEAVVDSYLNAVEEIINVPQLLDMLDRAVASGKLPSMIDELLKQARVEFNVVETN